MTFDDITYAAYSKIRVAEDEEWETEAIAEKSKLTLDAYYTVYNKSDNTKSILVKFHLKPKLPFYAIITLADTTNATEEEKVILSTSQYITINWITNSVLVWSYSEESYSKVLDEVKIGKKLDKKKVDKAAKEAEKRKDYEVYLP